MCGSKSRFRKKFPEATAQVTAIFLGLPRLQTSSQGAGPPLVLPHPGLTDSRAFDEWVSELAEHFHVFRPDRRVHGRTADVDGPSTYELMAKETIAFLERVVGARRFLLGHSDGAPVVLWQRWRGRYLVTVR